MDSVLQQHQAQQAARAIYEFDLPEELVALQDKYVKKTIGLRKLTMREEMDALDRSGGSSAKAGYLMTLTALAEVDGRPVDRTNAEEEVIMNNTDPQIRSLIVDGYTNISGVTQKQTDTFIKSRRVKVAG